MDDRDRARFVHDLWEFNDIGFSENVRRRAAAGLMTGLRNPSLKKQRIVDLHGWVLMGNHYHLLLSEIVDGGLTKFIRRVNVGYANYFNERYQRSGTLFQGRTKKILIESDAHFLHILHYIHLNPLDFLKEARGWREGMIGNADRALKHLAAYRWSSYLDYCKQSNFPSILTTNLFADVFKDYKKTIANLLRDMDEIDLPYQLE